MKGLKMSTDENQPDRRGPDRRGPGGDRRADAGLHDDISSLAGEIHELSSKFSAKEELAAKASELAKEAKRVARNNKILLILFGIVLLAVIVGLIFLVVFVNSTRELSTCQGRFNKAGELRTSVITKYTVKRDEAMEGLVEARGLPNDPAIIEARDAWLESNWMLAEARRLNPVVKYSDYCKPIWGVDPPKVPPAKVPDPALYPGPQNQAQSPVQ
jgi:hypothetical protein